MKQESTEKPPCFNSAREYEQWNALLVRSMEKGVTICDDCTNGYQEQRAKEGRCEPVKLVTIYRIATKKPT